MNGFTVIDEAYIQAHFTLNKSILSKIQILRSRNLSMSKIYNLGCSACSYQKIGGVCMCEHRKLTVQESSEGAKVFSCVNFKC